MDHFLTCLRQGPREPFPEAEDVIVAVHGFTVTLTLDDGETLSFDLGELLDALWGEREPMRRAA